jgi:hypothetical protein
LRINAPTFTKAEEEAGTKKTYYVERIALYKKVLDDSNKIIEPDYNEKKSDAIKEFSKDGILTKTYSYFPRWFIDGGVILDKDSLPLSVDKVLKYTTYVPIYNEGAEKIRTVSVKESNYFNNLQSIAETFEQWLRFDITRKADGSISTKKISFKNYSGNNNHACFRYGVNL